ncbi:peptidyl-tRNA hydrolase PTH2-domain-containing protein [Thelephora terrestris]|uniref:peptidyl-tRNA hydrolase n=1 Tax=Thelephora terrestris TaxID=56493 RepID=A0A9P6L7T5_9AGAM|nr:peptidyl-tRNA hydrolase PTH2-domain-containing protein [Thelephora terrestris]
MATAQRTTLYAVLTAALVAGTSLTIGYFLGNPTLSPTVVPPEEDDRGDLVEEVSDGDLSAITPAFLEPCKMVLVVRNDLKMTDGKVAAQCGHATVACYKALERKNPNLLRHWERTGQAKIALRGSSEDQLLELEAIAKSLNLCARVIRDAEVTGGAQGTVTVLGIGPAPVTLVNGVTGKLRLL